MSKLKPTWYQLINLDGEIGCVAYNAGQRLFRKWMPNKADALSRFLAGFGTHNVHISAMSPEDYQKIPTEIMYYANEKKEEETKPATPITSETRLSPNQSIRAGTINRIVLHNTVDSYRNSVDWLANPASEVSAHLVIGRDGEVCRMVEDNFCAWHSGRRTVNHQSIGIEIVATNEEQGMTAVQEAQVIAWVKHFASKYNVSTNNIVGHRTIVSTSCPVLIWKTEADLRSWVNTKIAGNATTPAPEAPSTGMRQYARNANIQLTANFNTSELQCRCGNCHTQHISMDLMNKVQELRTILNEPINVTSCYRCTVHNRNVGGVSNSLHTKGTAIDIWVESLNVDQLAQEARNIGGFTGIGRYYSKRFVHLSIDSHREGEFIVG